MSKTNNPTQGPTMVEVLDTLSRAMANYALANLEFETARNQRTDALSQLNAAQKQVDAVYFEIRKTSIIDSHWGQDKKGFPAE